MTNYPKNGIHCKDLFIFYILLRMELRKIRVSSIETARNLINAFARSHKLMVEDDVKLVWIYPDLVEKDDAIGCPCFACDCKRKLEEGSFENGIVYAKAFASQSIGITKFIPLKEETVSFFDEISDGEEFSLKDKQNRFPLQNYQFVHGKIVEKP